MKRPRDGYHINQMPLSTSRNVDEVIVQHPTASIPYPATANYMHSEVGEFQSNAAEISRLTQASALTEDALKRRFFRPAPLARFNIGGVPFDVPFETLKLYPDSLFSVLLSEDDGMYKGSLMFHLLKDGCSTKSTSFSKGEGVYHKECISNGAGREGSGDEAASCFEHEQQQHNIQRHRSPSASVYRNSAAAVPSHRHRNQSENSTCILKGNVEKEDNLMTPFNHLLVETDEKGRIFIDRDPATFRNLLNFMRGYRKAKLTPGQVAMMLHDAQYYQIPISEQDLQAFNPTRLHTPLPHQFSAPGPGISTSLDRLRSIYCVAPVGDRLIIAGRHAITFHIVRAEYLGFGVISDDCTVFDAEFHKVKNCCVYYMTGVCYSNFGVHKKQEFSDKFKEGDRVTIVIDMQNKVVEYHFRDVVRCFSCSMALRLRFAVVMKMKTEVKIEETAMIPDVPPEQLLEEVK